MARLEAEAPNSRRSPDIESMYRDFGYLVRRRPRRMRGDEEDAITPGRRVSRFGAVRVRTGHRAAAGSDPGPEEWLITPPDDMHGGDDLPRRLSATPLRHEATRSNQGFRTTSWLQTWWRRHESKSRHSHSRATDLRWEERATGARCRARERCRVGSKILRPYDRVETFREQCRLIYTAENIKETTLPGDGKTP